jgi:hypothetical protein
LVVNRGAKPADGWVHFGPPDAAIDPKVRHDEDSSQDGWTYRGGDAKGLPRICGDGAAIAVSTNFEAQEAVAKEKSRLGRAPGIPRP